ELLRSNGLGAPYEDRDGPNAADNERAGPAIRSLYDKPFDIIAPEGAAGPLIFASPHSGRQYPADLLNASRLELLKLRRSEDAFIDEIFADAPENGAPLLRALFPRVFVDANREAYELDPRMFADPLPTHVNTRSARVACGLGTLARIVANGEEIYRRKLTFAEAERRIHGCYRPYHGALGGLIDSTLAEHGCAIVIDCHSMPSVGGPLDFDPGRNRTDFVLGDRYGAACAPALSHLIERFLAGRGFRVTRNNPYAGGFTTAHYGRPDRGVHVLQIEINRALYMNEALVERGSGLRVLRGEMRGLMRELAQIDPSALQSKAAKRGR
ncbi:MAG: N-formylglutamate amidohydrolase, partial [Pseudomonadota bacterium]